MYIIYKITLLTDAVTYWLQSEQRVDEFVVLRLFTQKTHSTLFGISPSFIWERRVEFIVVVLFGGTIKYCNIFVNFQSEIKLKTFF